MEQKKIISVKNLSKSFLLPSEKKASLKEIFVSFGKKNKVKKQKVLDDVTFDVHEGDFFGIVGRNGSGKSTLLKILAGVYVPSSGLVHIDGALTPFIELGVGFNPELSGRDNVFLNGSLLGFSRKEMSKMYKEIVEFAELEEFMNKKLKNYSSGMQVRLAFSIAIKARNNILIFDEVLAVGDEAFQRKCLDVFDRYKAEKQTIILVTHDMDTVRRFCNKALLLNDSKVLQMGDPDRVARTYNKLNQEQIDKNIKSESIKAESKYLDATIYDKNNSHKQRFGIDDDMRVRVTWQGIDTSRIESVGITIVKNSGEHITGLNSREFDKSVNWREEGSLLLEVKLSIAPGKYHLLVELFEKEGRAIDSIFEGPQFIVSMPQQLKWSGLVELPHKWQP